MIPKIIHYSWFSGEEYPDPIPKYLETWHRLLPDYEFVLWDMERTKEIDSVFMREALQERKWAFAADVVRCYAVYRYGGIWLDIDVEMMKSFDSLLHDRMFIGKEYKTQYSWNGEVGPHMHTMTSHCFGAEAAHPFLGRIVEYYSRRHFVLSDDKTLPVRLRYDMQILPDIQATLARQEFGYDGGIAREDEVEHIDAGITVYPAWMLEQPKYHDVKDAVCVHHFFGAWLPENSGHEYENKGLYVAPRKDWKYYLFTFLNRILKRRGYMLRVICFGQT